MLFFSNLFVKNVVQDLTSAGTELESIYAHYSKFSPSYGDGTYRYRTNMVTSEFSPPYGDGIAYTHLDSGLLTFSPPCGDCTEIESYADECDMFSPPYGDCTR